jgi:HlyD family secretion protein
LEGGIVGNVMVRSGDRVEMGQVLMQLEEVQADAGVEAIQDQLDAELARAARADAERMMREQVSFAPELNARAQPDTKAMSLLRAESELFTARRRQWKGQTALLRNQTGQVRAEISGLQSQIDAANTNRRLLEQELEINRDLFRREFVQQTRLMGFERALAEKDEQLGEHIAELAKAQQKLVELDLRVISLQDDYVKRASDEYADANRRAIELRERLRPMTNTLARRSLEAPVSGEVVGLRVHAPGAVIAAAEVLMEIVPDEPALLVEGRLRPEDVADLAIGQPVRVQIMAFKQRSTPLLSGRVTYLSGDSLVDTVNGYPVPHFLVHATVDAESAKGLPRRLVPGMPATMFIETKPRSALDYLLQPLTDSMRKAFTEPQSVE